MLHCNGKCQMLKKIKKQEGESGNNTSAPKFNQQDEVLSSKTFFPTIQNFPVIAAPLFIYYNATVSSNYISSIFRPPANCNNI